MFLRAPCLFLSLAGSYLRPACAFPTLDHLERLTGKEDLSAESASAAFEKLQHDIKGRLEKRFLFDAMTTPVDVNGDHAFQPPADGEQRGPCPGLNALANHGYVSRDGIVSLAEVVSAINEVYGMGVELALVLGIMGVVWTGDPISLDPSFSIGKNDTAVHNALDDLQGILGTPQGLVGSHNFIESDSSPTRDDLYVTGNNYAMNLSRFESWYDMVPEGESYTSEVMAEYAAKRFHETVAENPYFYYGPFTGMIARNAGYLFITRLFANHSSEHPEGVLTHDVIKSFFGVYGDKGSFTYREGWEQIPQNWYKVPVDYGLIQLNLDTVDWILRHPELGSIGGNTGTVNSFAGVELTDLTSGVLNLAKLLESNNLLCFVLEVVKLASPTYLNNLYATLSVPLNLLFDTLSVPLLNLACPTWKDLTYGGEPIWQALQERFPGANMSGAAL